MDTLTFKTNIKCAACLATVTPFLNDAVGEGNWQVDMQSPTKVLTTQSATTTDVEQAMAKAGYKVEPLA